MTIRHPENTPFKLFIGAKFKYPRNKIHTQLESYSLGSKAIGDTSTDLNTHSWYGFVEDNTFYIMREDLSKNTKFKLLEFLGISEIDFTFDQNMNPVAVFVANDKSYIYFFNESDFVIQNLPDTVKTPRVELDSKLRSNVSNSDVILGYCNNGNLCYRMQRERYLVERVIATNPKKSMLHRIGETQDQRFAFLWR